MPSSELIYINSGINRIATAETPESVTNGLVADLLRSIVDRFEMRADSSQTDSGTALEKLKMAVMKGDLELRWFDTGNSIGLFTKSGQQLAKVSNVARRTEVDNLQTALDTLTENRGTKVIDSIREFEEFLAGITNEATLTGILKQLDDKIHADFANDMPVVNIGIVPVEPHRGGGSIGSSSYRQELYAAIKRAYDDDKGIIGMFQVSTGGGNYVNLHISGYKWRDDIQGMQFECAATDATATNIRLYFMRVSIQETFYDSSPLRRLDIPLTANAVFDLSKLIADLNGKMDGHYEDTDGVIEDLEPLALERAKHKVFIDRWNTAWGEYGCYDPVNAPDAEHPFMGNDVWMTYEEALAVMELYSGRAGNNYVGMFLGYTRVAALPPVRVPNATPVDMDGMFQDCARLRRVVFSSSVAGCVVTVAQTKAMFYMCYALREVVGVLDMQHATLYQSTFHECRALETVWIRRLKGDVDLRWSPLLSLESLRYMVDKAANTKAITITVHADVYAKLTDENNVEWHRVLTDAVARNITFATV